MKKITTLIPLLVLPLALQAYIIPLPTVEDLINENGQGYVRSNFEHSEKILDKQDYVTDKDLVHLLAKQDCSIQEFALYPSFLFNTIYIHERSNTAGKFPILSRSPPSHKSGKVGNKVFINDLLIAGTATFPWVSGHVEGMYTDIEFDAQENMQLRKYWVMVGDLNKFPMYFTVGRKTVPFGDFRSYAPFTHNHSTHYFWAQSESPIFSLGYYDYGFNFVASLIRNNRGFRVLNTTKKNGYGNFALTAAHHFCLCEDFKAKVGAGFLRGTIYDSLIAYHPPGFTAPGQRISPAWNVNASLTYKEFDIAGEFSQTTRRWPAVMHKVHAWTAQGRYRHQICCMPTIYSLMFSRGVQGVKGTEWERMNQLVAGFEIKPHQNLRFGFEYLFNSGFVPLIMPTAVGDRDVKSHTFLLGGEIIF